MTLETFRPDKQLRSPYPPSTGTARGRLGLLPALASVVLPFSFALAQDKEEQMDSQVLMDMRIEKAEQNDSGISVVATGSEIVLANDGRVRCFQRIPFRREVAGIVLPKGVGPLRLEEGDDFATVVSGHNLRLTIQGDSLIILSAGEDMKLEFNGLFKPAYHAGEKGRWIFIDQSGGFGVYPVDQKQTRAPKFDQDVWSLVYDVKKGDEIWVSIFPPRPYNWKRAYEDLMAHEGNEPPYSYPSNELIRSTARYCKVMVVHSWFWPGGDRSPWLIPEFVPKDMEEFKRMRDEIHRNGMKLVPYVSPFYYKNTNTTEGIFDEIKRVVNEYKADGVYFDGIAADFRKSYQVVRETRRILGDDRILFRHCTSDPLGSARVYCPFVDTYCDYIYRGESGRAGMELDEFLRWTLSGYNISNAVGYWVYTGSTGKAGYVRQAPPAEHIDAALRNEVRIPRTEIGYELNLAWEPNDGHSDFFDKYYYGKLAFMRDWFKRIGPIGKDK